MKNTNPRGTTVQGYYNINSIANQFSTSLNFSLLTLFFQSELLIASELAKSSQRADLESHLKSAESALAAKTAESQKTEEKFNERIRALEEKNEAQRDRAAALETQILEKVRRDRE